MTKRTDLIARIDATETALRHVRRFIECMKGGKVAADKLNGRSSGNMSRVRCLPDTERTTPERLTAETSSNAGLGAHCTVPALSTSGSFVPLGNTCTPTCVADSFDGPVATPANVGLQLSGAAQPVTIIDAAYAPVSALDPCVSEIQRGARHRIAVELDALTGARKGDGVGGTRK